MKIDLYLDSLTLTLTLTLSIAALLADLNGNSNGKVDAAQLLVFRGQVQQNLSLGAGVDGLELQPELNFAAFAAFVGVVADAAGLPVSALVRSARARLGLPLCGKCLQKHAKPGAASTLVVASPAEPVKTFTYSGKCPGCFKSY